MSSLTFVWSDFKNFTDRGDNAQRDGVRRRWIDEAVNFSKYVLTKKSLTI